MVLCFQEESDTTRDHYLHTGANRYLQLTSLDSSEVLVVKLFPVQLSLVTQSSICAISFLGWLNMPSVDECEWLNTLFCMQL